MELTASAETINAVNTEVHKTQLRFGAMPLGGGVYRVVAPAKGVAEDTGEVLNLTGSETTRLTGPLSDLLVTKDADLLDPTAPAETKYYARSIGLILTTEAGGRDEAVKVEKF